MEWDCGRTAVRMPVPSVGTALPGFLKAQSLTNGDHFARLEDGRPRHRLREHDGLSAHEFRFQFRLAVHEQEFYHLTEIGLEIIERPALGVSPRPARDVAYIHAGIRISFNDSGIGAHRGPLGRPKPNARQWRDEAA